MKIVKTRAFKDRLKGHKETIIVLHSPYGAAGGLLLSASKDGLIRGTYSIKFYSLGSGPERDYLQVADIEVAKRNHHQRTTTARRG